jgi:signal transduction histidine kinase
LDLVVDLKADICRTLGNIKVKSGDSLSAFRYYNESIDAAESLKDYRAVSFAYSELAKFYKTENQIDSSIYYASKGLEYAQRTSNRRGILACANLLAEIYESSNPAEAFRYFKIASEAKEGLFGAGNLQAIQALVAREEERKNEIEFARAAYQAQLKQYSLLVGLCVFTIIALLLYRNNLGRKRANELLVQQKAEIEMQKINVEYTLTELKSTQSQLIQSEKMASLGELTAGIAHEIKNPLNFINNFSDVSIELIDEVLVEMQQSGASDTRTEIVEILNSVKSNLNIIHQHGARADGIVKSMLMHSRSSTGQKVPADLNALIRENVSLSFHAMRATKQPINVEMVLQLDDKVGEVPLIIEDFSRVILNLCNNAFDAMREKASRYEVQNTKYEGDAGNEMLKYKPRLIVRTKSISGKVIIEVEDNGSGIPEGIRDKILQPFFTTKKGTQGTGLGLSITHDIIKAHGGTLEIKTESDRFSIFIINIT